MRSTSGTASCTRAWRGDARVVSLEGCDARRLDRALVPEPIGAVVADVSFISLTKALPAPLALAAPAPGSWR